MPSSSAKDFLLASKRCEIANLEELLMTGELVNSISQLVHMLQRERGLTNVFIASEGNRFGLQRLEQIEHCKERELLLRQRFAALDLGNCQQYGSVRLYTRIAYVLHGLDALSDIRERALNLRIKVKEFTRLMSDLIAGLLSVVFEAADTATDPDITRALVAMFNFMQGKELAGQERAWGASGFAAGHFEIEDQQKLHHLIEAQARCFETFADHSSPGPLVRWEALMVHECSAELNRLRKIVARSNASEQVPSAFSEIWYEVATCRIDSLKEIEELLASDLLSLCQLKLDGAKCDLRNHHYLLNCLNSETLNASLSFLRESAHGYDASKLDEMPPMGRSVYELLKAQSLRLQEVSDELQQARQALVERKTIERAKGLLIDYQGLTEEQAYRQIRQSAMEQNLRLMDIAEMIIERTNMLLRKK